MKIIKEMAQQVRNYLKDGKCRDTSYRLLRYILSTKLQSEDGVRFYNLVTGEVVELDKIETEKLNSLPCFYEPWMDELIHHHFIVEESFSDKEWVDFLRAGYNCLFREITINPYYLVMTTSACNAHCNYCYENGIESVTMTEYIADETAKYIATTCNGNMVNVSWYGGEPLLKPNIIDRICNKLATFGVKWQSLILTNAYLFDYALIQKAKSDWCLKKAIISLDGDEITYNKTKAYIIPSNATDMSPYYRVLNNIEVLLNNGIDVQIRLNLGADNFVSLTKMLNEIAPRFRGYNNCSLRVAILKDSGLVATDKAQGIGEQRVMLIRQAEQLGFKTKFALPALRAIGCMATRKNQAVIDPRGGLGKCVRCVFSDTNGSIFDKPSVMPQTKIKLSGFPECETCLLYPDCYKAKICPVVCSKEAKQSRILQMTEELRRL